MGKTYIYKHNFKWIWWLTGIVGIACLILSLSQPTFALSQSDHSLDATLCINQTAASNSECTLLAQVPTVAPQQKNSIEEPSLKEAPNLKQRLADRVAQIPVTNPFSLSNLFMIFFVTLGPIKLIAPFVHLTQHATPKLRQQLAFYSFLISTIVILLIAVIGDNILAKWTIRLPALMLAGGILLFLVSLKMIMSEYEPAIKVEPPKEPTLHLAVNPIAFPNILPPFGIAIALVSAVTTSQLGIGLVTILGALVTVMLLNLVCMLFARPILNFIKPVTLRILGFVLGVLQLALGLEFVLTALELEGLIMKRFLGS